MSRVTKRHFCSLGPLSHLSAELPISVYARISVIRCTSEALMLVALTNISTAKNALHQMNGWTESGNKPGANPTKLFFLVIELGQTISGCISFKCYKPTSLTTRLGKHVKTKFVWVDFWNASSNNCCLFFAGNNGRKRRTEEGWHQLPEGQANPLGDG